MIVTSLSPSPTPSIHPNLLQMYFLTDLILKIYDVSNAFPKFLSLFLQNNKHYKNNFYRYASRIYDTFS